MAKIKIITPIHVGDGDKIEAPCFHREGVQVFRYRFSDLIEQLSLPQMMNPRFLESLQNGPSSKSNFYSVFEHVDYKKIQPMYRVAYDWEGIDKGRDVASQLKDFGKPYIPGSTLKGAVENALNFAILITFFEKKKEQILRFLHSRPRLTEGYMLKMIFGDDEKKADDFMKEVYSCLSCSDIYFEEIEVNDEIRYHVYKDQEIPMEVPECIASGQETILKNLVQFDEMKVRKIRENKEWPEEYKQILVLLAPGLLSKACNQYTLYMLKAEQTDDLYSFYCDFEPINSVLRQIKSDIKECGQNEFYLRVGMHTNYFAKTISYFFKEKIPEQYSREFDDLFTPIPLRNKVHPDARKMPVTRTILFNEKQGNMLAGFIRVEL